MTEAQTTFIDTYLCPSDPVGEVLVMCCSWGQYGSDRNEDSARSNMAAVAGSEDYTCDGYWPLEYPRNDGMFGERRGCPARDVTDGLSNTLGIAEVTGKEAEAHHSPFWVSQNIIDVETGVNGPFTLPGGGYFNSILYIGPSSWHPGGCHFTFGDGSVHFLNEDISTEVLWALATRNSGESIGDGEF